MYKNSAPTPKETVRIHYNDLPVNDVYETSFCLWKKS